MPYTLDTLYRHIYQDNTVEFGPWQQWFAWRPVTVIYWYTDEIFTVDHPMKMGKTVWLKTAMRRQVTWQDGWAEYRRTSCKWQYTTFEELMVWG